MGEIFNALEVMNRTMDLGLSPTQLLAAEMGFKSGLARRVNPDIAISNPVVLAEGYELVAELRPRAQSLTLDELSTLARQEVKKPSTKVDAKTMRQIGKALGAITPAPAPAPAAPAKKPTAAKSAAKSSAKTASAKTATAKKATAKKSAAPAAKSKKTTAKRKG